MSTYLGEKRFSCDQCNYSCESIPVKKTFACNQCSLSYSRSSILRTRMLSHTGQKPFACKQCDYACKQTVELQRHMKRHTSKASTPNGGGYKHFRSSSSICDSGLVIWLWDLSLYFCSRKRWMSSLKDIVKKQTRPKDRSADQKLGPSMQGSNISSVCIF